MASNFSFNFTRKCILYVNKIRIKIQILQNEVMKGNVRFSYILNIFL